MDAIKISAVVLCLVMAGACGEEEDPNAIDMTNVFLTNSDPSCVGHVGSYKSSVRDVARDVNFAGRVSITSEGSACTISSNSIPNHDFNDGATAFVNESDDVDATFSVPANPSRAASVTSITLRYDNAIFINGIKLDLLAAACYGVGNAAAGQEKIGCMDVGQPFRYDPMSPLNTFGTDTHNAHTQPGGEYHYHGDPRAMHDESNSSSPSPVVGFAADGFPIFGPFFTDSDSGQVRRATSSYGLKSGVRATQSFSGSTYDPSGSGGAFQGEEYNGRFTDDYEYNAGSGDLDECNGMTVDGQYGYYITNSFPWVLKCFKGTPDESFRK